MGHVWSVAVGVLENKKQRRRWSKKQVLVVYERTRGRCYYCNTSLHGAAKRLGRWELDHVQPWQSKKAADIMENLVAACVACNRSKGTKSPEAFAREKNVRLRCRFLTANNRMCLQHGCLRHHWFTLWLLGKSI